MYKYIIPLSILTLLFSCNSNSHVGQYVDPNIGGIAPLLTTVKPQVHRPNSMVRIYPITIQGLNDRFLSDKIYGITLNMPRYRLGEVSSIMATSGEVDFDTARSASWYDHDAEELHPWSHRVYLQDFDVVAAWSTTERTEIFSFDYKSAGKKNSNVLFRVGGTGELNILDNAAISGYEQVEYAKQYFYAVANRPFESAGIYNGTKLSKDKNIKGTGIGAWFSAPRHASAEFRIGISYISIAQAKINLEKESIGKHFTQIEAESEQIWEKALSKIRVSGGTEREKRIFYTSLYRTYERMVDQSEYGRYYSGFDRAIHEDTRPFYNDDWIWDTYRNLHALGMILNPQQQSDQLASYTRMYEQWGWVPNFPELTEWNGDWLGFNVEGWKGEPMIGNHTASLLAEAVKKGVVDFDIEKMYEGVRKNALEGTMVPWRSGAAKELDAFYCEHGYFPALYPGQAETYNYVDDSWEKRQAVSVTLEQSYDDWCLAQVALYLGHKADYDLLMKRSHNYLNLWNKDIGYFAPKDAKGNWITPFDPQLCDGFGARSYFAEVNACVHAFHVQHDISQLITLMGGNAAFVKRLDDVYNEGSKIDKWKFMGRMPDATGLHGMIPTGNEPAFHIPFLYNYAGQAWKTQYRVRQIADLWFDDRATGLNGDEDGGALTAWYVFAAMGFYPVNPASGEYALSSPIFEEVDILLPNKAHFIIKAPDSSKTNKYIQSAKLNGHALNRPFIAHDEIISGGILELEMGPRPSSWGNDVL